MPLSVNVPSKLMTTNPRNEKRKDKWRTLKKQRKNKQKSKHRQEKKPRERKMERRPGWARAAGKQRCT